MDKVSVARAIGTPVSSNTRRNRKRPADHENAAEETAQKKSRRGSAKDNPDQRIQDCLETLSKPRWTKGQKDWVVFHLSLAAKPIGMKCRGNSQSGLV